MSYCSKCGNELNENASFCDQCGHKVDVNNDKTVKNSEKIEDNNDKIKSKETKLNNTVSKAKDDFQKNNFDFSNLNFATIGKFSIVGLVIALIIGIVFFNLTWGTVTSSLYEGTNTGLTWLSFIIGVIVAVGLLSAHMEDISESIVMGVIVGLLTGGLESSIVSMFMGRQLAFWFELYIGNQIIILLIVGAAIAYIGNMYLKDKIHLDIISQYLGG